MTDRRIRRVMEMTHSVALLSRYGSYRFGSVILFGKRVISVGVNNRRTHPDGIGPNQAIHAELHAINVAESRVGDLAGGTIAVARAGVDGSFLPSFPCPGCLNLILEKDIKRIVYMDHSLKIKCADTRRL